MLPIPQSDWRRKEVLASWVELSAIAEEHGFAARGDVLNTLNDSSLFAESRSIGGDVVDSTVAGSAAAMAAEVWVTLAARQKMLGDAWPFQLTDALLTRKPGKERMEDIAAYASVLVLEAACSRWYEGLAMEESDEMRGFFEAVVAASMPKLCSAGRTQRFGKPYPDDWPNDFPGRVKRLADVFGLRVRSDDIAERASPYQQDGSLDVVARIKIGDEGPATAYMLIQCATGRNWLRAKRGEPMMSFWGDIIAWNAPRLKVIAVPFVVREKGTLVQAYSFHDCAVILDRLRIACGDPDGALDPGFRQALAIWCRHKLSSVSPKSSATGAAKRPKVQSRRRSRKRSAPAPVDPLTN